MTSGPMLLRCTVDPDRRALLTRYSRLEITASDLRRELGGATFGDVLRMMGQEGLPLPVAPTEGREATLARAREWMFPKPGHG